MFVCVWHGSSPREKAEQLEKEILWAAVTPPGFWHLKEKLTEDQGSHPVADPKQPLQRRRH